MMVVLLIAGIGILLAGLVTVGLGIELDLSFGNTLILAGAIVACTGMIMGAFSLAAGPSERISGDILPFAGFAVRRCGRTGRQLHFDEAHAA